MSTDAISGIPQLRDGHGLERGWYVKTPMVLTPKLEATSVFVARNDAGEIGFMKVPWHAAAAPKSTGPKKMTARHDSEVSLLRYCSEKSLPGIIRLLDAGMTVDSKGETFEYLITKMAEENADFVFETLTPELLWWLASHLMQIAHSLANLHANEIYHRDVTTRNLLLDDGRSKSLLTDLGHAYRLGHPSPVDDIPEATPVIESPPERFYFRSWSSRREKLMASDLYQFGAILFKMMVGKTLTYVLFDQNSKNIVNLSRNIANQEKKVRTTVDRGFKEATRQLNEAFQKKLPHSHQPFVSGFMALFKAACHPDLNQRGHPKLERAGPDLRHAITPFVDDLIALVRQLKQSQLNV
jgi:serine/threonine protein kinase